MDKVNFAKKFNIPIPNQLEFSDGVLVVDDQQDLRLIVVHHLRKKNFSNVYQAPNGFEALELMKGKQLGVIISDYDMPQLGGVDFLAELQETPELSRVPFCLAIDNVSKEKVMLAVESGADEVLVKPLTLNDVIPKLRKAFSLFHNPSNPEIVYELAKLHIRNEDLDQAYAIYGELASTAQTAARPLVGQARVRLKQQDYHGALQLLSEAEQRNSNYVHTFSLRGEIYAAQNDWDQAIASFRQAIELSPLNPVRYKTAVEILFKVYKYQEATELLNIALKHELEFNGMHHYLSQAHFAQKDFKTAYKHIKIALTKQPDNVVYLNQAGICLKEMQDFDEAMKVYNRIIKKDPANEAALYNKAVLLKTKGDLAGAIKLLERVVLKHPDFAPAKQKLEEYKAGQPAA